jgi:hypothetical protein
MSEIRSGPWEPGPGQCDTGNGTDGQPRRSTGPHREPSRRAMSGIGLSGSELPTRRATSIPLTTSASVPPGRRPASSAPKRPDGWPAEKEEGRKRKTVEAYSRRSRGDGASPLRHHDAAPCHGLMVIRGVLVGTGYSRALPVVTPTPGTRIEGLPRRCLISEDRGSQNRVVPREPGANSRGRRPARPQRRARGAIRIAAGGTMTGFTRAPRRPRAPYRSRAPGLRTPAPSTRLRVRSAQGAKSCCFAGLTIITAGSAMRRGVTKVAVARGPWPAARGACRSPASHRRAAGATCTAVPGAVADGDTTGPAWLRRSPISCAVRRARRDDDVARGWCAARSPPPSQASRCFRSRCRSPRPRRSSTARPVGPQGRCPALPAIGRP